MTTKRIAQYGLSLSRMHAELIVNANEAFELGGNLRINLVGDTPENRLLLSEAHNYFREAVIALQKLNNQ